ncbi:MAG: hypothetical protein AAF291_10230 [Pseudomonadota bacterium]
MAPLLPFRSVALFHAVKRVKRGDIVLVDTAEYGRIVRKVRAVSVKGRVSLHRLSRIDGEVIRLDNVDPDRILGKLALRMRWARFLPYFGPPPMFALRPVSPPDTASKAADDAATEPAIKPQSDWAEEAA